MIFGVLKQQILAFGFGIVTLVSSKLRKRSSGFNGSCFVFLDPEQYKLQVWLYVEVWYVQIHAGHVVWDLLGGFFSWDLAMFGLSKQWILHINGQRILWYLRYWVLRHCASANRPHIYMIVGIPIKFFFLAVSFTVLIDYYFRILKGILQCSMCFRCFGCSWLFGLVKRISTLVHVGFLRILVSMAWYLWLGWYRLIIL